MVPVTVHPDRTPQAREVVRGGPDKQAVRSTMRSTTRVTFAEETNNRRPRRTGRPETPGPRHTVPLQAEPQGVRLTVLPQGQARAGKRGTIRRDTDTETAHQQAPVMQGPGAHALPGTARSTSVVGRPGLRATAHLGASAPAVPATTRPPTLRAADQATQRRGQAKSATSAVAVPGSAGGLGTDRVLAPRHGMAQVHVAARDASVLPVPETPLHGCAA